MGLLAFATLSMLQLCILAQNTRVRINQGVVIGMTVEVDNLYVIAYLGIPFAKTPTGSRRFKPPEPHSGWNQPLNAVDFGPICPQPFQPGLPISEDCLTLNVWSPAAERFRLLPIVVVFEGEFFITSNPTRFPGQDLAVYNLIVVTVNYRVNAFGFLSWQDQVLPGNLGLLDQLLALRWISENIESFGGNPQSITLLGHSAGGASVSFHLASENSRAFFQRAVILSGSSLAPWAISRRPRVAAATLAMDLGCKFKVNSPDASFHILNCLQSSNLSFTEIINRVQKMVESGNPYYLFAPVHDAHMSQENRLVGVDGPQRMLENVPLNYPVLIGLAQEDGSVIFYIKREMNYMSYSYLRRYGREILVPFITSMKENADQSSVIINHLVDFTYLQLAVRGDKDDLIRSTMQMFTDSFFAAPIFKMAEIFARRGLALHMFVNDFISPDIYNSQSNLTGALHGAEIIFLFSPSAYIRIFRKPLTYEEAKRSEVLKKMIYSFAVRGEPNLGVSYPPLQKWSQYTLREPTYALLSTGKLSSDFRYHNLAFWNFLLPDINKITNSLITTTTTMSPFPLTPTLGPIISSSQPVEENVNYQSAVWVLLALLLLMVGSIVAFIICARRQRQLKNSATIEDS